MKGRIPTGAALHSFLALRSAERGYRIPMRIVGALTTAFSGVLIIALNTAVH